jgi:GT2 family glycosyltransferase
MKLAVVVITHNRRAELLHTLDRLAALPERPPVVVVDNGSGDGTAAAVRLHHPGVTLIELPDNRGALGRNVGVAAVDTPYVAFCDDDTWWEPGALERAAEVLDLHPQIAVLTARIVVQPAGVDDPINEDMRESGLPRGDLPGYPLLSFLAGASVVRREAFEQVGGFSPLLGFNGEEELLAAEFASAGWSMRHLPELVVHHAASAARDHESYLRRGVRNSLWFWWLRRPVGSATRRTAHLLVSAPRTRAAAAGLWEGVRGMPYVLRHRRVVPSAVERGYRVLDPQQMNSRARRHVAAPRRRRG